MDNHVSRRWFLNGALAAGAGLALAGCGSGDDDANPSGSASTAGGAAAATSMLMGRNTTSNFTHVPLLLAARQGYFSDEGLTLETTGLSSAALPAALIGEDIGSAYLGVAGTLLDLTARGNDLVCVALATYNNPNNFVVAESFLSSVGVSVDDPLEDRIQALESARFAATDPGAGTEVTIKAVMEDAGVDPEGLNISYLRDIGTFVGAMQQGNVDAFAVFSPVPEQVTAQGFGVLYLSLAESGIPQFDEMAWTSVWMRRDVAARDEAATQALVRGLWRAQQLIQEDPDAAREAVRPDFADIPDDVFAEAWENNLPTYPATPELTAEGIQKAIDLHNRSAQEPFEGDPDDLFVSDYVDAVADDFA